MKRINNQFTNHCHSLHYSSITKKNTDSWLMETGLMISTAGVLTGPVSEVLTISVEKDPGEVETASTQYSTDSCTYW